MIRPNLLYFRSVLLSEKNPNDINNAGNEQANVESGPYLKLPKKWWGKSKSHKSTIIPITIILI